MKAKSLAVAAFVAAVGLNAGPALAGCPTKGVKELTGAGATFPYPLYSKMFSEYNKIFRKSR